MLGASSPQKAAINLEIERIESVYFSKEKSASRKRGRAFQYLCLSLICDVDLNEIDEEDIVDGRDEEGLDMIFIRETEDVLAVNVFNCNSSEKNDFSANEMTKIGSGLDYIFQVSKQQVNKIENIKLKKKIDDVREDKEKISEVNIFYCVFNGQNIGPDIKRKKEEIEEKYNTFFKAQYPKAKFIIELVNYQSLFSRKIKNTESLKDEVIKIPYYDKGRIIRTEISTSQIEGYLTTFKAENIARLVDSYGDTLFEKNIRGWLKHIKTNREIYNSCVSEESNIFWFLNNGITIIGDNVFADDDKAEWKITNLQIVNGQQTAKMIHEAFKEGALKNDVKVMCRIYKLSNGGFINKITKATNSQSSIGTRDLMSNDDTQSAIADCFEKRNYNYERQRGQEKTISAKLNISSKKLAQASLAILCKKPSLARKNIEDNFFNPNKYYYQIFNRDPKNLLLAYLLYEYCNDLKDDKDVLKYFGALHIARIIWELKEKEFENNIEKTIEKFEKKKINLSIEYQEAIKILKKIAKREKVEENDLGHYFSRREVDDLLFKELQKNTKQ